MQPIRIRVWARRIRRLAACTRGEIADLLRAQWALGRAQLTVFNHQVGRLLEPATIDQEDVPDGQQIELASRMDLAIARVAENGLFRPSCLVRAIALQRMLESNGLHGSRVRLGVRSEDGGVAAHAWVVCNGRVLGDRIEHVRRFELLADFDVVKDA